MFTIIILTYVKYVNGRKLFKLP